MPVWCWGFSLIGHPVSTLCRLAAGRTESPGLTLHVGYGPAGSGVIAPHHCRDSPKVLREGTALNGPQRPSTALNRPAPTSSDPPERAEDENAVRAPGAGAIHVVGQAVVGERLRPWQRAKPGLA